MGLAGLMRNAVRKSRSVVQVQRGVASAGYAETIIEEGAMEGASCVDAIMSIPWPRRSEGVDVGKAVFC